MNLEHFNNEGRRLAQLIEEALHELRGQAIAYASAERNYRKAKARAWVMAPRQHEGAKITAGEREAWVDGETAELREARDVADGLRQAALEAVRSHRGQVSALQTALNAHQEDQKFARTGQAA